MHYGLNMKSPVVVSDTKIRVDLVTSFSHKNIGYAAIVGVYALLLNFPLVSTGFDAHHQGLMLASAMGVVDGLAIHGEVFSQYGPITSWTQALFLLVIPTSPALALNIWSITIIVLTAVCLALIPWASRYNLKVSPEAALFGSIVWVSLSPELAAGEMFAWSSLLAGLVGVTALLLGLHALGQTSSNFLSARAWFCFGLAIGIMPFIRLNVGGFLALVGLIWTLIALASKWVTGSNVRAIILGGSTSLGAVLIALALTKSLNHYWLQSVIGPLQWAEESNSVAKMFEEIGEEIATLAPRAIPLAIIGIALLAATTLSRGQVVPRSALTLAGALFLGASFAYAMQLQDSLFTNVGGDSYSVSIPQDSLTDGLFFVVMLSLALTVVRGIFGFRRRRGTPAREATGATSFAVVVASGLIFQFWPTLADRQLWWGSSILFVLFFHFIQRVAPSAMVWSLAIPVGLVAVVSFLSLTVALDHKVTRSPQSSSMEGLRVEQHTSAYIAATRDLFSRTLEPGERAFFLVIQGSDVVADGEYRASNTVFTSWAQGPGVTDELSAWEGKSVVDTLSLSKLGVSTFRELEKTYGLVTLGCSFTGYSSELGSDDPYLCVLAPER